MALAVRRGGDVAMTSRTPRLLNHVGVPAMAVMARRNDRRRLVTMMATVVDPGLDRRAVMAVMTGTRRGRGRGRRVTVSMAFGRCGRRGHGVMMSTVAPRGSGRCGRGMMEVMAARYRCWRRRGDVMMVTVMDRGCRRARGAEDCRSDRDDGDEG